ncbi:hypothetical protein WJX84_007661 [Apatococcus fuscideae]|uniref:mannan endo-1,4-beta-mannosidase n=1 Tax=Apatococcus fuscideae TaxID=2026836 RepID=A0AAW1SMJ0_9CHLO
MKGSKLILLLMPAGNQTGQRIILDSFAVAAAAGFNVVRTYAHTTDPRYPFQDADGEWRDDVLEALDFVIEAARSHGLRVMLSFADNWKYLGGVPEYLDRSPTAPQRQQNRPPDGLGDSDLGEYDEATRMYELERHTLFYSDEGARELYKEHVQKILQRRNTLSGLKYKEDPIILGWALLNEMRCESWKVGQCPSMVQSWIEEMASFVKEQDPRHLLTVGMEGFWGRSSVVAGANPGQWAEETGQNFTRNHLPVAIDFATTHIWPDNWDQTGATFQMQWLAAHIKEAEDRLGKPLLLEEFGKKLDKNVGQEQFLKDIKEQRDPIFRTLLAIVKASVKTERALQGWLFWRWDMPVYAGHHQEDYAVRPTDSTFRYLAAHAHMLRRIQNSRAPRADCKLGCWLALDASADRTSTKMDHRR